MRRHEPTWTAHAQNMLYREGRGVHEHLERAALKELREAIGRLTCEDCGKLLSDREWSGCIVCQSDRALLHPEDASG